MSYKPDSAVTTIVIHYSATPIERDYTAADIDQMHRARGFKEIGYHFFIRKDGTVEAGRDMSQPGRFEVGAHSKGENSSSIGVCFEGGVRASAPNVGFDSRTHAQKTAMIALIISLQERFPGAVVKGHRDMPGAATQCPGFNAGAWWDEVSAKRVAEMNVVPDASKGRKSLAQSSTMQASAFGGVGAVTGGVTAIQNLEGRNQTIAIVALVVVTLALLWICKERVRYWVGGLK